MTLIVSTDHRHASRHYVLQTIVMKYHLVKSKQPCNKTFEIQGYTNGSFYLVKINFKQIYQIEITLGNHTQLINQYFFEIKNLTHSISLDLLGIYQDVVFHVTYIPKASVKYDIIFSI